MGLTNQVRDFFTNRINKVLDAKRKTITDQMDTKKVDEMALKRFSELLGLGDVKTRLQKIEQQEKQLKEEEEKVEREIRDALTDFNPKLAEQWRYRSSWRGLLEETAEKEWSEKITLELYPDLVPQLKKLDHIREDVEGAVLLATTEPKLVATLTKLLTNYGGDISELLDLIPKQD